MDHWLWSRTFYDYLFEKKPNPKSWWKKEKSMKNPTSYDKARKVKFDKVNIDNRYLYWVIHDKMKYALNFYCNIVKVNFNQSQD